MDYREHIQRAIDCIEEHLTEDLDLRVCAAAAGYSLYHFIRIFREATKLTPADYIRKRRLSEAARAITGGESTILEAAFAYGFNSGENFLRAFRAEHGILPTEYRDAKNSLQLCRKIEFSLSPLRIEPQIVTLPRFCVTAYPDEGLPAPVCWNRYNCMRLSKRLSGGAVCEDYGISVSGLPFQYFIGIRSEQAAGDTAGTVRVELPGGAYAVFKTPAATHFDFVNTIHASWRFIQTVWLPQSGLRKRAAPEFETYTEESRSFSETIYIPIENIEKQKKGLDKRYEKA